MLGSPTIAETKVKQFNEDHPEYSMSGRSISDLDNSGDDEIVSGAHYGDKLMSKLQYYRNNLVPREDWNPEVLEFEVVWSEFKKNTDTMDFTDLIEKAGENPPNDAVVGFVDEAQDLTPLQIRLIRRWGEKFRSFIVCGDDDQALYRWAGASAKSMLYPKIPDENKVFLDKTWRCPPAIQAVASRWIERVSEREPKNQQSNRDIEGEVVSAGYGIKNVLALVDDVEEDLASGKTVMILTACSFQLTPVIVELRSRGIPFWNKYRLTRGDWNPIRKATINRILSFLEPEYGVLEDGKKIWSLKDLLKWGEIVKWRGIMPNGFMKAVENVVEEIKDIEASDRINAELTFHDVWGLHNIMDKDLQWLYDNAKADRDKGLEYPMTIIDKYGVGEVKKDPRVIVGTVHCSPPDERVLTADGPVAMIDLDPSKHGLAGYHKPTNSLMWGRYNKNRGYPFIKNVSKYNGPLITIKTDRSKTRVTPEHRVVARFSDKFVDKYVVYLMERKGWFRVGICVSARRPYRSAGVGGRLATEQGDYGWILKVCNTRKEALIEEERIRAYYGITGLTFEVAKSRTLSKEDLYKIHEYAKKKTRERAVSLFQDFGLFMDQPLYLRSSPYGKNGVRKRNMRGNFVTVAANLMSEYMEVLVPTDDFNNKINARESRKAEYKEITISREMYDGDVYSLEVLPHHFYISGGAVVHNSVKGGESKSVYLAPDISKAAYKASANDVECYDDIVRQFYVGMTRASEKLTILAPSSQWHVKGLLA